MTCCEHPPRDHTYDTATRTNTGPCLVHGCGCQTKEEEE